MREILFKAKRIDNGEWVKGYYLRDQYHRGGKDIIFYRKDSDWFTVYTDTIDPKTLCQFTGLYDKNGKRIWENDVVIYEKQYAPVKFGLYRQSMHYYKNIYGFYVDFPEETFLRKDFGFWNSKIEVVGNIFDNPELLQGESDE